MDTSKNTETTDFYNPGSTESPQDAISANISQPDPISWSASEFLNHQKSSSWYMLAVAIMLATSLLLFVLTDDYIGPISVMILGSLLLVGAARKPRTVEYLIDAHGIVIGGKEYLYDEFQSFSLVREDQIESIALFPHKRFVPVVSLYFAPDDGQKIFDLLSEYLPFEQREKDQIDRFLHKIKF